VISGSILRVKFGGGESGVRHTQYADDGAVCLGQQEVGVLLASERRGACIDTEVFVGELLRVGFGEARCRQRSLDEEVDSRVVGHALTLVRLATWVTTAAGTLHTSTREFIA